MRPLESANHQPKQSPNHQRLTGDFCTDYQQLIVVKEWAGMGSVPWDGYGSSFSPAITPFSNSVAAQLRKHWASAVVHQTTGGNSFTLTQGYSGAGSFPAITGELDTIGSGPTWAMGNTGYLPLIGASNVSASWSAFSSDGSGGAHMDFTLSGEILFDDQLDILKADIITHTWDYLDANPATFYQVFTFKELLSLQGTGMGDPDIHDAFFGDAVEGDYAVTFDGTSVEATGTWSVVGGQSQTYLVDIQPSGGAGRENYFMSGWAYRLPTYLNGAYTDADGPGNVQSPIVGVRTRFKNVAPSPITYFFAGARITRDNATAAQPGLDDVSFVEYGTIAPHHVKEIPWYDGDDDFTVTDGSGKLSVGSIVFCIIAELPSEWVTRTGIPMDNIPGGL